MNSLTLKGQQEFMGISIPVILGGFGEDKKCISDKTIAVLHGMEVFNVRKRITSNIHRFKESVDYIDFKQRIHEINTLNFLNDLGYAKQSITQAEHIYLLSERGYAKLIKIMDSDLAWDIHDRLIDEYFQLRENRNNNQFELQLLHTITPILNNQTEFIQTMMNNQQIFNEGFNKSMSLLTQVLLAQHITPPENEDPVKSQPKYQTKTVNPATEEFKKQIYALCGSIVKNSSFNSINLVLSHVYRIVTRKYGIAWDQERKDYEYKYGYKNKSLLDIIANSEEKYLKSIVMSILRDLDDYYKEEKTKDLNEGKLSLATNWIETHEQTILLAKGLNDNSPNAILTYNKIYQLMESHNNINWNYYKACYKKDNKITAGKLKPTKKQIIKNKPRLQKMYISALNNLIEETVI